MIYVQLPLHPYDCVEKLLQLSDVFGNHVIVTMSDGNDDPKNIQYYYSHFPEISGELFQNKFFIVPVTNEFALTIKDIAWEIELTYHFFFDDMASLVSSPPYWQLGALENSRLSEAFYVDALSEYSRWMIENKIKAGMFATDDGTGLLVADHLSEVLTSETLGMPIFKYHISLEN